MNDELQHWREHTESLVASLIEEGSNEEIFHTIEHHFASEDFNLLEQAAIAAFKMGFEVEEPEEAELEDGNKIFAFDISTEQPLEVDVIFIETKKMLEFSTQHAIDYDGWGTYFEE